MLIPRRILSFITSFIFAFNFVVLPLPSYAQGTAQPALNLPAVGTMVTTTPPYVPTLIKGITIHPDNALMFDFVFEDGDRPLEGEALKAEFEKLIKYFLAALTVPEKDLWVNLSPYEGGKVIPMGLGDTEMGRDLLAQDYLLKQLTASLMYPEQDLGRKFWDKVFERAYELYGKTNIPLNTFNKVWIVPDKAVVLEQGRTALVVESHLKVMLEEDYAALEYSRDDEKFGLNRLEKKDADAITDVTSKIVREVLIPAIEEEVNNGETFANLRQIYHSMVLATWYKQSLRESLLGQVYVDQNKTQGVDTQDKEANQKIYAQYMEAFQKGVYDYIRHDYDKNQKRMVQRKYFSGGVDWRNMYKSTIINTADTFVKSPDFNQMGPRQLAGLSKMKDYIATTTGDVKAGQELQRTIDQKYRDLPVVDQKVFQETITGTAPRKIRTVTTALVENAPTINDVPYRTGTGALPQITKEQIVQFKQDTAGMKLNPDIQRYYADVADKIVETPSASTKKIEFPTVQFSDISREMVDRKTPPPTYETSRSVPVDGGSMAPSVFSLIDDKGGKWKMEATPIEIQVAQEVAAYVQRTRSSDKALVFYATPENVTAVRETLQSPYWGDTIEKRSNPRNNEQVLMEMGIADIRVEAAASPLLFKNGKLAPATTAVDIVDIGSVQSKAIEAAYTQSRENPSVVIIDGGRGSAGWMSPQVKDAIVDNLMKNNTPIAIVKKGNKYVATIIIAPRIQKFIDVLETTGVSSKFVPQMVLGEGPVFTSLPETAFQGTAEFVEGYPELQDRLAQNGINKEPIKVFDIQGFMEEQAGSPIESLKDVVGVYTAMDQPIKINPITFKLEEMPYINLRNPDGQSFSPQDIGETFSDVELLPGKALTVINKTGKVKLPSTENVSFKGVQGLRIENNAVSPIDLNDPSYLDPLAVAIKSGKTTFGVVINERGEMSIQDMDLAQISASPVQVPEISADAANIHKKGGIDFNAAMLHLQIKRDGAGVPLPISNQPVGEMNIQGFVPVILDIQTAPAVPAPLILGETEPPTEELSRVAD